MNFANGLGQRIGVPVYLNPETIAALNHQLAQIDMDTTPFIFLENPAKGPFCLGLDIRWALQSQEDVWDGSFVGEVQQFVAFLRKLSSASCITVACIDGMVVGGGLGIVSAADLVLATDQSSFQLSEGLFGLVPGMILPFLLDRLSSQTIKKMVFTAKRFSPAEAMAIGLVDDVADQDEMASCLHTWTTQLQRCQKQSIKDLKFLVQKSRNERDCLSDMGVSLLVERLHAPADRERLMNLAYFMEEDEEK